MDKSKSKGKPSRRRLIILVVMVLFSGCVLTSIVIFNRIPKPRYQAPILSDIEVGVESLLEARLLEYVTIGESTRIEVEEFGDDYLSISEYSCLQVDEHSETCYPVDVSMWGCNYYIMEITFQFEDDILSNIEFDYHGGCL